MPRVCINLVTHNNEKTISTVLEAALTQTFTDTGILVIDNASSDATLTLLDAYPVQVIQNRTNAGYAAAHNQALKETDSSYILTLNPDVKLFPDFVEYMVDAVEHCRAGSAAGKLLRVNHLHEASDIMDSAGLFMRRNRRQGLRYENRPVEAVPHQSSFIFGPDGAAAFYRRAMLVDIAVNGEIFDEDFFMHKEDVDICWRALLRNWYAVYVPDAVAYHIRTFRPGKRNAIPADVRFYAVRNRYLCGIKNENRWHVLWDSPAIIIYDLAILIYLLFFEPKSLKALASAWGLLPKMLRKRAIIQQNRCASARDIRKWFRGRF